MMTFLVLFLSMLVLYLLLVLGSGSGEGIIQQLFSIEEMIASVIMALLTAGIARAMIGKARNRLVTRPYYLLYKPIIFVGYLFYLFFEMAKANLDVAYRVITGNIRPGIVRIKPKLETALGRTFLANSITLTPGTLTVDIDDESGDLFIHWINVGDTSSDEAKLKGTSNLFSKFARWVTE